MALSFLPRWAALVRDTKAGGRGKEPTLALTEYYTYSHAVLLHVFVTFRENSTPALVENERFSETRKRRNFTRESADSEPARLSLG